MTKRAGKNTPEIAFIVTMDMIYKQLENGVVSPEEYESFLEKMYAKYQCDDVRILYKSKLSVFKDKISTSNMVGLQPKVVQDEKVERLKSQSIDDYAWYLDLSKSQKEALKVTHNCQTMYDLLGLFSKRVCGMKGFSEKNFIRLKRTMLRIIQGKVCCYQNKYIKIYHDAYAPYTGEHEIEIYVENNYPVDDALSVSFDKADIWGRKLKEGAEYFRSANNGKAQVMVRIDGLSKSEIVLRCSQGKQLLNTDFYAVECKPEIIFERIVDEEKELVEKLKKENESKKLEDPEDQRIQAITYLHKVGILSENECNDIVRYLKGEAEIFEVEDFSDDDLEIDFFEE